MIIENIKKDFICFLYKNNITFNNIDVIITDDVYDGDISILLFDIMANNKIDIKILIDKFGTELVNDHKIKNFNLIKGFFNISLLDKDIIKLLSLCNNITRTNIKKTVIVEYSSPNTNKPLHLGHLRNICLGYAVCQMLKHVGYNIKAVTLVNDRGIHICKSMLAYIKEGLNTTPQNKGIKGDHFVGDYYVMFDKMLKQQKVDLNIVDDKDTPLMHEAQDLLVRWENNDNIIRGLWKKMNNWVLEGFDDTYSFLGIKFDKTYFESDTYLLGKDIVTDGLNKNVFYKDECGAVWVDLTSDGLDKKLLLRADGTSVYITQDLGTADMRYKEFTPDKMIYVVGDEQEYHFVVLKNILKHLGKNYADNIYHLSYGMIDLPSGKMKSREGTVVDADDLIADMIERSRQQTQALRGDDFYIDEEVCKNISLAALKFYLLKINDKKRITFDPNKSIDFHGDTGPFILYTYVRINSVLAKNKNSFDAKDVKLTVELLDIEKKIIMTMFYYERTIDNAVNKLDPSQIAQYLLRLAKTYNKFYGKCSILNEIDDDNSQLRLIISKIAATIIKDGLSILGINTVDRM